MIAPRDSWPKYLLFGAVLKTEDWPLRSKESRWICSPPVELLSQFSLLMPIIYSELSLRTWVL